MKINFHKKIAAYFGYEFTRINKNLYEDQNTHIFELIERNNINLVLDIGANVGQFSLGLRKTGYKGEIISFEPIKECYEHLISISDNNWHIYNFALGDSKSTQNINISKKTIFSSFLETSNFGKEKFSESISIVGKQSIEIYKLDEILKNLTKNIESKKIFLKLDTQGYDSKVLKGATNTLNFVYALQTEVSCKAIYKDTPSHFETLKQLSGSGFNITGIFPLSHDDQSMELLEFDCVLTKTKLCQ